MASYKMKSEIYYNTKLENYTLKKVIEEVKSIKKIPIKFKLSDDTSKFRKRILQKKLDETL